MNVSTVTGHSDAAGARGVTIKENQKEGETGYGIKLKFKIYIV